MNPLFQPAAKWVLLCLIPAYVGIFGASSQSALGLEPTFSKPKFKRDRFRLALEGAPYRNYRVEVSWDQKGWSEVITTNSPSGRFTYVDHIPPGSSQGFYRALLAGNSTITLTDPSLSISKPVATSETNSPPPVISQMFDQTVHANRATDPISFTVEAMQTPTGSLNVTTDSSNPLLVPPDRIFIAGSGAIRTLVIIPALDQTGITTITLTVTDSGGLSASSRFVLTVTGEGGPATFFNRGGIMIPEFGRATPSPSTITVSGMSGLTKNINVMLNELSHAWPEDIEVFLVSPTGQKTVLISGVGSGYSLDNVDLTFDLNAQRALSDESQVVSGTYVPTSFNIQPSLASAGLPGAYVTSLSEFNGFDPNGTWGLYVIDNDRQDDGLITAGWSLTLSTAINSPPRIESIPNQMTATGLTLGPIDFQIYDAETPEESLLVSGVSSDPTIVPQENIILGGHGSNRTVSIIPAFGQTGSVTITLTVVDGSGATVHDSFSLAVISTKPPEVVVLPIEAIGEDGTTESAIVNVSDFVTRLGPISLWVQIHGLGYPDKASVQVNNSTWISLNNSSSDVAIANPGKGYGGIGGGFATLKMTISLPSGTVVPGANTVRFRFNFTDGNSVGYRVLKFNFLSSAVQGLLDASAFRDDDPSTWQPPRNTAAEIDQGKSLWYSAQLTAPFKSSLLPGGSLIQAHCTDCHAQDGRDLKYFNYSNRSIIERAKFHGLSVSQGELIASYIRSLNMISPGRPWNPPYQPGPGLDSKPVSYWAAGAGVDWVLDRDEDALPYIFPGGVISSAAIAPTANLSAREVPIVMQLPDWNHWLPTIHPKDAWRTNVFISNGSKLLSFYNGDVGVPLAPWSIARSVLKKGDASSLSDANWILASWVIERYTLMKAIGPAPWSGDEVSSQKVYGTGLWQLTKMWELMQEFEMEDLAGPTLFGPRAEPRTWTPSRLVFDVSPNIEQLPVKRHGINDNQPQTHRYFSMAWYHLQLILNNGNRSPDSGQSTQFPVDWGYIYGFLKDVLNDSNVPNAMHYYLWAVKGLQTIENGLGPEHYNSGGWNPHTITDPSHMLFYDWARMWANTSAETRKSLIEAYLRNWLAKNKQYSPDQYYTGENGGITKATYIPVHNGPNFGDSIVTMFVPGPDNSYFLNAYGIDKALQIEILEWAKTIWPLADWDSLRPG